MRKTIGNEIAASVYTLRRKTPLIHFICSKKYAMVLAQPAQRNKQSVATSICFPRHDPMCVQDESRIIRGFIYLILFIYGI